MTDKQKEAIRILNKQKGLKEEEYFTLLEFIIEQKTEIQYVPQPMTPWPTPIIGPYYGGTADPVTAPPYRVTCESDINNSNNSTNN